MSWQSQLKGDSLSWLLSSDTPAVRYLALRHLLDLPENDPDLTAARSAAHRSGPIAAILDQMQPAGYWCEPGPGYNPKYFSTVWSIILLAQLGADIEQDARISQANAYLLEHALTSAGQFTASGAPSGTADCLQGNLTWALLELGVSISRLEAAIDWMARSVTGEGIAPLGERSRAQRYYAGKCGPGFACGANNQLACAWGATKVMLAFSKIPPTQRTPSVQRAIQCGVELLLGTDPSSARYPSPSGKPNASWFKFGFPVFYVTDFLQVVEALVALGYASDPRLAHALDVILSRQDAAGRWPLEYDYGGKTWVDFGPKRQPSKWVTLRALRVIKSAF